MKNYGFGINAMYGGGDGGSSSFPKMCGGSGQPNSLNTLVALSALLMESSIGVSIMSDNERNRYAKTLYRSNIRDLNGRQITKITKQAWVQVGNYWSDQGTVDIYSIEGRKDNLFLGKGSVIYDGDAWGGTNFVGTGPDAYPYRLPDPKNNRGFLYPIDAIDKAAQRHDYYYWIAGAGGIKGALFDKSVASADALLAFDAFNIMQNYWQNAIDPVTGHPISDRTFNMALFIFTSFAPISAYKSFP